MSEQVDRLNLLLTLGRHAEGEKAAREAIAESPDWASAYGFLAQFLSNQGRHLAAIRTARVSISREPHNPWSHTVHAQILKRLGRSDRALEAVRESLRLDPTFDLAFQVRCEIHSARKDYQEAHSAALEGLAFHPTDEWLLYGKGWSEYKTGFLAEACRTAETGLSLHPSSQQLHYLLGSVLMDQARHLGLCASICAHARAHRHLKEATRLDPGELAIREIYRENALRCRRLIRPFIVAVFAISITCTMAGAVTGAELEGVSRPGVNPRLLFILLYFPAFFFLYDAEEWVVLSAPLERFGIPTLPLPADEKRSGRWLWPIVLGSVVAVPALSWALILVTLP